MSEFLSPHQETAWSMLQSGADPLFMSLVWRKTWWERWGALAGTLVPVACEDDHGAHALALLYLDRMRVLKHLSYRRLQLVGCSYGTLSTPRSEYNSFLLRKGDELAAFQQLAVQIEALPWQEFVLQDVIAGSFMDQALQNWCVRRGWVLREILHDIAYAVDTTGSFDAYLAGLGSNTRLKLFNRRKLLASLGTVTLENLFPDKVDAFFALLNEFHRHRWGCDCFGEQSLAFHKRVIKTLSTEGASIDLSLLALDGKPLSVLYNIRCNDRVYNVQSGYLEHFHPKISLGSLHLGYAIEAAFAEMRVSYFDLLAGKGKQTDYKRALAPEQTVLKSYKIVRSPLLRLLYTLKDWKDKRKRDTA